MSLKIFYCKIFYELSFWLPQLSKLSTTILNHFNIIISKWDNYFKVGHDITANEKYFYNKQRFIYKITTASLSVPRRREYKLQLPKGVL